MTKKEIILEAGARLFAKRSFNSVGIRDIAAEAGVNSAMISYYFGGKVGLLREIFLRFDRLLSYESGLALEQATSQNDLIRRFVSSVLDSARMNRDVYLVGLKELNHDSEDLHDLREDFHSKAEAVFVANIDRLGINIPDDPAFRTLGFTATLGMIFSDYLLGGGSCLDDDTVLEAYKQTVITILQSGMPKYWA
ncbi:TetR/AcrR family transcriptional regulator [Pseudodesulfovibrio portus]|uniref:HTH tetR-type domain-containing protein n=1 Tax=Pseudodesulfovibrio portus TaxID=231439 RepID=A0ABN6RSG5_9BACT|nr:TetR/AcrR family transcriptional regulator [Pseudodesulfovibrio portus]BDQ34047.1 hypothetical protein JCM14722_15890 [Pseudodesulfovibrio portus]